MIFYKSYNISKSIVKSTINNILTVLLHYNWILMRNVTCENEINKNKKVAFIAIIQINSKTYDRNTNKITLIC